MAQDFTGRKLIVVGGSSGMGRQIAADVVSGGGSAVVIGSRPERVEKTVTDLAARGQAWGITADLRDPANIRTPGSGRSASDLTPAPTDVRLDHAAAHLAHPTRIRFMENQHRRRGFLRVLRFPGRRLGPRTRPGRGTRTG